MPVQNLRWRVFQSLAELQAAAVADVLQAANTAIASRGQFLICLAGGLTPKSIYRGLRSGQTDWSRWHVYYGDERCLPVDAADRNSLMAETSLLRHVPIPAGQIHPIRAELGPESAVEDYCGQLAGVGAFDCVLLGMGEDGHTASLFPGQVWEDPFRAPVIAVHNAPKPPLERVTLVASRLSHARQVIFLLTGAGKRSSVRRWRDGAALPVAAIKPLNGVDVYLDAAADS